MKSSLAGAVPDRTAMVKESTPFSLLPTGPLWLAPIAKIAEHALGLAALGRCYRQLAGVETPDEFLAGALNELDVLAQVPEGDLDRIPRDGPLIVVANHPHGAIDGILLGDLLLRARPDLKILGNRLLERIEPLRPLLLPVEVMENESEERGNARSMRRALEWLDNGGALMVFPAGEVAHSRTRGSKDKYFQDSEWHTSVARLQRRSGAAVTPVFIEGDNGSLFRMAGHVHPNLRTALLPRALLAKRGSRIGVRIGHSIAAARVDQFETDRERTDYLRLRSTILSRRQEVAPRRLTKKIRSKPKSTQPEPLIDAIDPVMLAQDVAELPAESLLTLTSDVEVRLAWAPQIPHVLREIGRLRERTFRLAGEGSGKSCDLDDFDRDYMHLFLWHPRKRAVLGAYRMGRTDQLLAARGETALYTSTLFRYDPRFLDLVSPGLELGRAFVTPEWQRNPMPLFLLWRGIATWVSQNPRYRLLFGPVSISAEHHHLAKDLMIDHLREFCAADVASWVRPRNPLPRRRRGGTPWKPSMLYDLGEVSRMVTDLDNSPRGVPVLIREYLKLGGQVLAFNVDPDFADVIDGLMLIDLDRTDPRRLGRYMGREECARFLATDSGGQA